MNSGCNIYFKNIQQQWGEDKRIQLINFLALEFGI